MASLSANFKVGSSGTSSLIKSANSISTQLATYQDAIQATVFRNSIKSDSDYASYEAYLKGRIGALQASGTVANQIKALSLTNTMTAAMKSNISANIQRENINIMTGNSTLTDKYNTIVNEYNLAVSNGDDSLAQSLMSQAYSVSQSIQYQNQQALAASTTLAKANASQEGSVITQLDEGRKQLVNGLQQHGEAGVEATIHGVMDKYGSMLSNLGAVFNGTPNYFDLMAGIAHAQFNAYALQAQIYAPVDPAAAQTAVSNAQNIGYGITTFDVGGAKLSYQELQQAAANPNMFTFDYSTGQYQKSIQSGVHYETFQTPDGQSYQALVPTYSGVTAKNQFNAMTFLNTEQVNQMHSLGLNFTETTSGNSAGTTGDGVKVNVTDQSPDWLKNLIGVNNSTNVYKDAAGNLTFAGPSTEGTPGGSEYTLITMNGLHGVYENLPDGSYKLAGGDYGFNAGAAQLLVGMAQQAEATQAEKIALNTVQSMPKLSLSPLPTPQAPTIATTTTPATYKPQVTVDVSKIQQAQTPSNLTAPSSGTQSIQSAAGNIQSSGSGIKITGTTNASVGMRL